MAHNKKLTLEEVKRRYLNNNLEFLDIYVDKETPAKAKCLTCFNIYFPRPGAVFRKMSHCPKCSKQKVANEIKRPLDKVKELFLKKNLEYLDDFYTNKETKHNVKCLTCDHSFTVRVGTIINKKHSGCPFCWKKKEEGRQACTP